MSRTLTAFFDSRSDAERASERLADLGIGAGEIRLIDQSSNSGSSTTSTAGRDKGVWQSIKDLFSSDDDYGSAYAEGVRRGGTLLTVSVDETQADRAIDILDDDGAVDFEQRVQGYRNEGWTGGAMTDVDRADHAGATGLAETGDARIPIFEEQLRVGKREVSRGGVRVHSWIREEPVTEQVRLREEHVEIERRPVNQRIDVADGDLLRERTIEVSETAEEAVVGKEAFVREELVVHKDVGERVETVSDTVRRTEVEVDDTTGARGDALTADRGRF